MWAPTKADARTRTGDPFITSEVLYQLSYVGVCRDFLDLAPPLPGLVLQRCGKIQVGLCVRQAYLTRLGPVHCGCRVDWHRVTRTSPGCTKR